MKNYIVTFIGPKGLRNNKFFKTEKSAMNYYEKCSRQAIVKKYNPELCYYETIKCVEI